MIMVMIDVMTANYGDDWCYGYDGNVMMMIIVMIDANIMIKAMIVVVMLIDVMVKIMVKIGVLVKFCCYDHD